MKTPAAVAFLAASLAAQTVQSAQGVRFRLEEIATNVRQPVALAFLPDGRALFVQRQNPVIHILDVKTGTTTPVENGITALVGEDRGAPDPRRPVAVTGEDSGLHDLVLHPDYARNGWIYLSYSSGTVERSTTVVDRFRLRGNAMADRERIFTADAFSEDRFHYGGRMVWKDGFLYLSIGDRHHQDWAQDLTKHSGKILRLTEDGKVPPDNPFIGHETARAEIWTYGNRNVQGMVVHPQTGEIWASEHGPLGGDELNLIKRGANYGWALTSWGLQYSGGPIGMGIAEKEGIEPPVWVWTPGIAPSSLIVYTGDRFPQWKGSLLGGAMSLRHVNRLVLEEGRVVLEERILNRKIGRVRLVAQGPDGTIYLGTDPSRTEPGKLYRLVPGTP